MSSPSQVLSTPEEAAYELRAAESSIWTGGRLLIGLTTFAFASLAFAYFYLRSANSMNLWRPGGITAPTGLGAAIFAIAAASAALNFYGTLRLRQGSDIDWKVSGWTAVFGLLLAAGLQIYELTRLPFFPGSSGYASTFIAWSGMNIAILLMGAYWLETLLARATRLRKALEEDGGAARSKVPAARLFRVNVESCGYFLGFSSVVGLLFWVLFYVV